MQRLFCFTLLVLLTLTGCTASKKTSLAWRLSVDDWRPSRGDSSFDAFTQPNSKWENDWFDDDSSATNNALSSVSPSRVEPVSINPKNKFALVIGNGSYKESALLRAANDAATVAAVLTELGFQVVLVNDANMRKMEEEIDRFYLCLKKGGLGLFYYAGHGVQIDGDNYLIPVRANINDVSDIKYESINAGRILDKMAHARNVMNIIILDASRPNTYVSNYRSVSRGLARVDSPPGSIIAYSSSPGTISVEDGQANSIFTRNLIKHMKTPGIDVNTMFINIRMDVINETAGKQVPWDSSSLTKIFCFHP